MKTPSCFFKILSAASIFSAIAAHGQVLFSDSMDSATGWTVNSGPGGAINVATFGFDYSSLGIPASPHGGGTTTGLKLEANRPPGNAQVTGTFSGISVSPTGKNFAGDYQVRFDSWQNFNMGGLGSTQLTGAGIGTAGTTAQWAGATYDSLFFMASGDGGTNPDYRVYPVGNAAAVTTGYYAAGTGANSRDNLDPYYASFGGRTPPAPQGLTGTTAAGSQGFAWHDVAITKTGNTVTWDIDGLRIATVDTSTITTPFGGTDILFNQSDINGSTADNNSLVFGLVDNVTVTQTPEPSTFALIGLGGLLVAGMRQRKA